jgi:exopolyphosphatase / guanosine-5'-triphosphate,3'-diphosphate pyrophosphatase
MIVSSIDIGTNAVILLIAKLDFDKKKVTPLYNEQRIPRIGKKLESGMSIEKDKIEELFKIMEDYRKIINKYKCEKNFIIGTNALRISSNGNEIVKEIKRKFDLNLEIIDGEKEAYLSFLGAVFNLNLSSRNIVIDIGGGSTEIIYGSRNEIDFKKSINIGVVSASEEFFIHNPPLKLEIEKLYLKLKSLFVDFPLKNLHVDNVIAIAGTPTTLAAIHENLEEFDEQKVEGHILFREELKELIGIISQLSYYEIVKKYKSVVRGREDVILAGSIILFYLMEQFDIEKIKVSTKGIRYGKIIDELFN